MWNDVRLLIIGFVFSSSFSCKYYIIPYDRNSLNGVDIQATNFALIHVFSFPPYKCLLIHMQELKDNIFSQERIKVLLSFPFG